jgi:ubiquitin-conjugating enzyme E2 G2
MTAYKRLMHEAKQLATDPPDGIAAGLVSADNLFLWNVVIVGPDDTPYEAGLFTATLSFPRDYPFSPPKMKFTCPMWHPNVYASGEVCISILHPPGADQFGYEAECERWTPSQSIEKILLSVMSMLAEPNTESGANIDAAKEYRDRRGDFEQRVRGLVRETLGL